MMICVYPIRTGLIKRGDDPISKILDNIPIEINERDVLVISSKPLLIAYNKTIDLNNVKYSDRGLDLAYKYDIDPRFGELIISYSDRIYGGVSEAILTEVDGIIIANAGIDRKNVGGGELALPFTELKGIAKKFYDEIFKRFGVRVGVIITDSMVSPLRKGTKAVAVYIYGFKPVKDYRGVKDLYGRVIRYTQFALADSIASAAHLVIGEGAESIPAALVKGVDIELVDKDTTDEIKVGRDECIYRELYKQ